MKKILALLLSNHYLIETKNLKGTNVYKVLTETHSPVLLLYKRQLPKRLRQLLKRDEHRRYRISRKLIRQLHGNDQIKQLYSKLKK